MEKNTIKGHSNSTDGAPGDSGRDEQDKGQEANAEEQVDIIIVCRKMMLIKKSR